MSVMDPRKWEPFAETLADGGMIICMVFVLVVAFPVWFPCWAVGRLARWHDK
jgi:hypothetical protein